MKTHIGIIIALCILISMLLFCHTMNILYPIQKKINNFNNLPPIKPLQTQYNIITYDNQLNKIPCGNQAQIPCNITQKQCSTQPTKYILSDSELAILYKKAYEIAGNEVLFRALQEMQQTNNTNSNN